MAVRETEALVCLYVDLIQNSEHVTLAVLTASREFIEHEILTAPFDTNERFRRRVWLFKLWCFIIVKLTQGICTAITLHDVHARSSKVTQENIAQLVSQSHANQDVCSILPVVAATQNTNDDLFTMCALGIQLCCGWLHCQLARPLLDAHYYLAITDPVQIPDRFGARLAKIVSSFVITQCRDIYDKCFFTRLSLLMNNQERLSQPQHARPFRALEAYHHDKVNENYERMQKSDIYSIVRNSEMCDDVNWGIIAACAVEYSFHVYDQQQKTVLRTDFVIPTPGDDFLWLDLDHQTLFTSNGQTNMSYDLLLCYYLQKFCPTATITMLLFKPETLPPTHVIMSLLET